MTERAALAYLSAMAILDAAKLRAARQNGRLSKQTLQVLARSAQGPLAVEGAALLTALGEVSALGKARFGAPQLNVLTEAQDLAQQLLAEN